MKKRNMRGFIALCCTLLMVGCGGQDNDTDNRQGGMGGESFAQNTNKREEETWQAYHFALGKRYDVVTVTKDSIYGCYEENGELMIACLDKEDFSLEREIALPEVTYVQGMEADGEGNVYVFGEKAGEDGFWKIDMEGNFQEIADMALEDTENALFMTLKGIFADGNEHFYIWYEMSVPEDGPDENGVENVYDWVDRVYVKDAQFHTLFYEQIVDVGGTQLLSFQVNDSGEPVFVVQDLEGIYIQKLDVEQENLGSAERLDGSADSDGVIFNDRLEHVTAVENGFLFCQEGRLYEYHYDTQQIERVLELSAYGIYMPDILYMRAGGDSDDMVIEIIDNHGSANSSEFTVLRKGRSEQQILTFGVIASFLPREFEQILTDFNRYHEDVRVEMVNYLDASQGDYDAAIEQLKLDIVTGNAPDLLEVSSVDYDMFTDKGVLSDLYGFMQEDSEFTKDMLMPSVAGAYERDGHLYSIAPAFQLYTMWGAHSVIQGRQGVTFEELIGILQENGKDLNAINGFSADEPVLTTLCNFGMDEFVDWENKTCSFDGEYFKGILSFAKERTGGGYAGGTTLQNIREGEILIYSGILSNVADYQIQEELFGGEIDVIGYPTAGGSGTAISFRGSELAVNAAGENKETAWEFVKYYLLHGYDGQGFPVVREQFDAAMVHAMEDDYVTSVDGTERSAKEVYHAEKDYYIIVYAATQAEVDAVINLVENVENRYEYHTEIQNIINEEVGGFFTGQKSLDETAEIIQNRVSLYLQE